MFDFFISNSKNHEVYDMFRDEMCLKMLRVSTVTNSGGMIRKPLRWNTF